MPNQPMLEKVLQRHRISTPMGDRHVYPGDWIETDFNGNKRVILALSQEADALEAETVEAPKEAAILSLGPNGMSLEAEPNDAGEGDDDDAEDPND